MSIEDSYLDSLQRTAFDYFLTRCNPDNGLVPDTSREGSPASIAGVGFALSVYPVAVERGWMTKEEAVKRTLTTLRFFGHGPKSKNFNAIGHRGFCYHFLDMQTGLRAWECEVSFIDTALLLAGMLMAASYFSGAAKEENEIRELTDQFYRRIDWVWALNKSETLDLSWKPHARFAPWHWDGYSEGLILYIFGLASPTFPLEKKDYDSWASFYKWRTFYGIDYLHGGPLFMHQFSHAWIDFRGIQDDFMRLHQCDYFENTRRATLVQQHYAIENKFGFKGYGQDCWGLSAGDGPSDAVVEAGGMQHPALGYAARGVPEGPDDGTLMPSAMISSLPFAPEMTLKAIEYLQNTYPEVVQGDAIPSGFNPSLVNANDRMWLSDGYYSLDQGIIIMMIEHYRSDFIWSMMRDNKIVRSGLEMAGFSGGWLKKA